MKHYVIKSWDDNFDCWLYKVGFNSWSDNFEKSKKYTLDGLHVEIQSDSQSDSWKFMEVVEPVYIVVATSAIYLHNKGLEVATHIGPNDLGFYYQNKYKQLYKFDTKSLSWYCVDINSIKTNLKKVGG